MYVLQLKLSGVTEFTLLLLKTQLYACGQIQVSAEFESLIFDEVQDKFKELSDWETILCDFTKYLVFVSMCISYN